jgi:hypothetical protein
VLSAPVSELLGVSDGPVGSAGAAYVVVFVVTLLGRSPVASAWQAEIIEPPRQATRTSMRVRAVVDTLKVSLLADGSSVAWRLGNERPTLAVEEIHIKRVRDVWSHLAVVDGTFDQLDAARKSRRRAHELRS